MTHEASDDRELHPEDAPRTNEFVVYGWSGMSRFDASALVTAADHMEAAEIFMRHYPFNVRYWDPHKLKVERPDRSDLKIFEVRSLDPLLIEPAAPHVEGQ